MKHGMFIAILSMPALAVAQDWEVSYDYIEVGYGQLDVDLDILGTTLDSEGPLLELSTDLADHLHLFATYGKAESDQLGIDTSYQEQGLGLGVHFNVQPSSLLVQPAISIFARLGYIDGEITAGPLAASDDGISRSFGVRFMPGPRAEFRGAVEYVDLDSTRSGTAVSIGGDIYVAKSTAIRLSYTDYLDEDANALSIGVRFYFRDGGTD
jgi:hypothetical protein